MIMLAGDIETQGTTNKFICGSIAYRIKSLARTELFHTKEDFENRIIELGKENGKAQIYFHNTEYDFFRFADLKNKTFIKNRQEGYKIKVLGKIFLVDYLDRIGNEIVTYYDTWHLMKMSLKNVGEELGYSKGGLKESTKEKLFNNGLNITYTKEEMEEIESYNKLDARICLETVERIKLMLKEEGYCPQRMISAGQITMSLFNNRLKKYGLRAPFMRLNSKHNPYEKEGKELFRHYYDYIMTENPEEIHQSYRGALILALQTGKFENCTNVDFNSLFPYSMTKMRVADLRTEKKIEEPLKVYGLEHIISQVGCSKATIEVPEIEYGYLPIRYKLKRKVGIEEGDYINLDENVYPNWKSEIKGVWTNFEIENAIKLGYKVKDIDWSIIFCETKINPFKLYVEEMYEKRKKNKLNKWFYKLLLNNLHGKLSQISQNHDYTIQDIGRTEELEDKGYNKTIRIGYNYLFSKKTGQIYGRNYAPIISAYTTAMARKIIYDKMCEIPKEDLLYVANDALLFKGNHLNKFKLGKDIGEYKLVNFENKPMKGVNVCIHGKNNYIVDKDYRISGVKKEYITKENIKKGKIEYERFTPIVTTKNIEEIQNKQKLEKDLVEIEQKTREFNKKIRDESYFIDSKLIKKEKRDLSEFI